MAPLAAAPALDSTPDRALRFDGLWLFSPRADLSILLVPVLVAALCAWLTAVIGADFDGGVSRQIGRWTAQYVLFNGTHVILTFLLLGTRRELLTTTKHQATLTLGGGAATLVVTSSLLWFAQARSPLLDALLGAAIFLFAAHHTVSQVKGFWALYNLRGKGKVPPMTDAERNLQKYWVPLSLGLMAVRVLFLPRGPGGGDDRFPLVDLGQAENGCLPYALMFPMLAVWLTYALTLGRVLVGSRQSGPKTVYLLVHTAEIAITIVWPAWGAVLAAGMHGLEYAFLTARMLEPLPQEKTKVTKSLVWPVMILSMLPLIAVGVPHSPFVAIADAATGGRASALFASTESLWSFGMIIANGIVLAHYFADAFMYRFRIPKLREVTLSRLGLA